MMSGSGSSSGSFSMGGSGSGSFSMGGSGSGSMNGSATNLLSGSSTG